MRQNMDWKTSEHIHSSCSDSFRKIPKFLLISWYGKFVERPSFLKVSGVSHETLWRLCLFIKFSHQEIRWNFGILVRDLFSIFLRVSLKDNRHSIKEISKHASLLKKGLYRNCFFVNCVQFLEIYFLQSSFGKLLLFMTSSIMISSTIFSTRKHIFPDSNWLIQVLSLMIVFYLLLLLLFCFVRILYVSYTYVNFIIHLPTSIK